MTDLTAAHEAAHEEHYDRTMTNRLVNAHAIFANHPETQFVAVDFTRKNNPCVNGAVTLDILVAVLLPYRRQHSGNDIRIINRRNDEVTA